MSETGGDMEAVPRLALTPGEVAAALGISRRSAFQHVLPEVRVVRRGRLRMVPVRELERWLQENAERVLT